MRKIAVRTKKGGIGKSTTTANVVFYLASKGKKVYFVDVDSQANLTLQFLEQKIKKYLHT